MRKYMLVPLPSGLFEGLSLNARCVFGLLFSRRELSGTNHLRGEERWFDRRKQEVYCLYSYGELSRELGCSVRTVQRALEELRDVGFVSWEKNGYQASNRYYINPTVYNALRSSESV